MFTLYINVDNLICNIRILKSKTNASFCAVVKANAYGHGFELAKYMSDYVDSFAVSSSVEVIELRKYTSKPIYVLCPSEDVGDINAIYCAYLPQHLTHEKVCVKINTGMNRLGITPSQTPEFLDLCARKNIKVDSVFTHFSDISYAKLQLSRFESIDCKVKRHAFASNFLKYPKSAHLDMIRCGLAMYGYGDEKLKPVLSAYTDVLNVLYVKNGDRIGYVEKATKDMKIAVLAVGYADCIRRQCQSFFINGKICSVVGNVCMDTCLVDVSDIQVKIGDKAQFLGENILGEQIASDNNTIVYDVLTSFGSRCRRIYEQKGT